MKRFRSTRKGKEATRSSLNPAAVKRPRRLTSFDIFAKPRGGTYGHSFSVLLEWSRTGKLKSVYIRNSYPSMWSFFNIRGESGRKLSKDIPRKGLIFSSQTMNRSSWKSFSNVFQPGSQKCSSSMNRTGVKRKRRKDQNLQRNSQTPCFLGED